MFDKELVNLVEKQYPNTKIISAKEIGIPISHFRVSCYFNVNKKLPSIVDAVIRMYELEEDVQVISRYLGVDDKIIIGIVAGLSSEGYINYFNKTITDKGRKYIHSQMISSFEKGYVDILINNLTGEVLFQEPYQLSTANDIKKQSIHVPYLNNSEIKVKDQVNLNNVLGVYKRIAEKEQKYYETEDRNLTDILKIADPKSVFLKVEAVLIMDRNNKLRVLIYDRANRNEKLEEFINSSEYNKKNIYLNLEDLYTIDNVGKNFIRDISFESVEQYHPYDQSDTALIDNAKKSLIIILPMIECNNISNDFFASLEAKVSRSAIPINLYISGVGYPLESQSIQMYKLIKLSKSHKLFKIYSLNKYAPRIIICDSYEYLIKDYSVYNIFSNFAQKDFLVTKEYKIQNDKEKYKTILLEAKQEIRGIKEYTKKELRGVLKSIFDNIAIVDELLDNEGLGWTTDKNPTLISKEKIIDSSLTFTEQQFNTFISSISKTFVEQFKKKSETKKKNYFDNEFSTDYPELYLALNKIRVYRNYFSHTELNKYFNDYYYSYVREDFNNYFPYTLEDCYLHLQKLLLAGLLKALELTKDKVKREMYS
ncbi:hypothetical protein [Lactococcus lactis]|uniref:hypothetical protein n=1 Tax=Lactococcus lactis TaxID=1358 RepID=UPI0039821F78